MTDSGVVMVFDALSAVGLVVFCAAVLLVGLVSRRHLRPMSDLPEMDNLWWSARWFGPIMVAGLVMAFTGQWLGVGWSQYPLTALALGQSAMVAAILLPIILLPRRSDGWLLGLLVLLDALRLRERDYREWVYERYERGGRQGYEWAILVALLAGPLAALSGVTWASYQADAQAAALGRVDMIREVVAEALTDADVAELSVAPTTGNGVLVSIRALDDSGDDEMEDIRRSADEALRALDPVAGWQVTVLARDQRMHEVVRAALVGEPLERVVATHTLGVAPARIEIVAPAGTDEAVVKRMGDKVDRALVELGVADDWQINVLAGGVPERSRELPADIVPRDPYDMTTQPGG
jgi:hypothetical protein